MSKGINTFNDIDNDTVNDIYRRKSYRELTFTDDYMFCRILADDPELQALRKPEIPRRSRYYQSVSDIDQLDKGMKYGALPDMYVIFICMFDPFGEGLARYEFRNLCMEGSRLELGDGTCKILINARSKRNDAPPELKSLMDYLCGKEPCSNLTRYISDSIRKAKDNRRWERNYMYFEENLQEAKALGKEEGLTQGREEGLAQGREEMISAIRYLTDNGRTSEINRLAAGPDFLTQILKEMGS